MFKSALSKIIAALLSLIVVAALLYRIPPIQERLAWRIDVAFTYLRGIVSPAGGLPTALPATGLPPPAVAVTRHPTITVISPIPASPAPCTSAPQLLCTPAPQLLSAPSPFPPTPVPLPESVSLPAPAYEKQAPNNCGPATLAMYLRAFGWEGDQTDISDLLKPQQDDRNVNVEELAYYVRTRVGWLNVEYRVGGSLDLLEAFLAAGLPVMIEEGMTLDETYWPDDDHWAGHYLLLTGYDENTRTFTAQDSFRGADQSVPYAAIQSNWQAFNYVYTLLYRADQAETVQSLLGENWNTDTNRQRALELAQTEAQANPQNPFAWFNLGSNLVYFERYAEAARAYDTARSLGLPQRMLRYQFGPFFAYFFSGRNADLLALSEYALKITPTSEETLLWRGWGLYREGKKWEAVELFNKALRENPNYADAKYALDFVEND